MSVPPGRNTRKHSRQTGRMSGTNTFEHGWNIMSKDWSGNLVRSVISPSWRSSASPSRSATALSCESCAGELSKTETSAPAAAKTGACWPPADARARSRRPFNSPNHDRGTGLLGVSTTVQSPRLARAITSLETGTVHGFPRATCRSHASRLCRGMSMLTPPAQPSSQRSTRAKFSQPHSYSLTTALSTADNVRRSPAEATFRTKRFPFDVRDPFHRKSKP